jgi:acyl-coenzyme A thioesterase PaaI-like protein
VTVPTAERADLRLPSTLVPPLLDPPADAETPVRHPDAPAPGELIEPHNAVCRGCADVEGGLRMVTWADEGTSVLNRFDVLPVHQGAPGLLHGGFLTAVFDEALGRAYQVVLRRAVTARLEVDFRRPVPVGTALWVRARVDAVAGRKVYCSGTAHLDEPDGRLAGNARGLYIVVEIDHFLTHGRPEDLEAVGATPDEIAAARRS